MADEKVYERAYGFCSECEKIIRENELFWTVNVHHEKYADDVITVLDAKCAFIFCEECATKKDFEKIIIPDKN